MISPRTFQTYLLLAISLHEIYGYHSLFGTHLPFGASAVKYLYSVDGTFINISELVYVYNYYEQYSIPPDHPYDQSSLVKMANGNTSTTCLDANAHLLCDFNHDGAIVDDMATVDTGSAFYEHNGKGMNGETKGNPFSNFWFDDNLLARLVSNAYNLSAPFGLSDYTNFTRWRILYGPDEYWTPYRESYMDTLALDGMYYLTKNDVSNAVLQWQQMVTLSGAVWNETQQLYLYPDITENYHEALFRILTDTLYEGCLYINRIKENDDKIGTPNQLRLLRQHSQSLRKAILGHQQVSNGEDGKAVPLGWLSSISDPSSSLQNTESIVLGVMALSSQYYGVSMAVGAPGGLDLATGLESLPLYYDAFRFCTCGKATAAEVGSFGAGVDTREREEGRGEGATKTESSLINVLSSMSNFIAIPEQCWSETSNGNARAMMKTVTEIEQNNESSLSSYTRETVVRFQIRSSAVDKVVVGMTWAQIGNYERQETELRGSSGQWTYVDIRVPLPSYHTTNTTTTTEPNDRAFVATGGATAKQMKIQIRWNNQASDIDIAEIQVLCVGLD